MNQFFTIGLRYILQEGLQRAVEAIVTAVDIAKKSEWYIKKKKFNIANVTSSLPDSAAITSWSTMPQSSCGRFVDLTAGLVGWVSASVAGRVWPRLRRAARKTTTRGD